MAGTDETREKAPSERSEPTTRLSTFRVPGMDCPSEERLIRLALEPEGDVQHLAFDLQERTVRVWHAGSAQKILSRLEPLGFGAQLAGTETGALAQQPTDAAAESRVLRWLLTINTAMFFVELTVGLVAQSTGLIADSLDMFADAAVYGVSLYAVGRNAVAQRRAARASGWLQLLLALGALGEVLRRALVGSEPVTSLMIGMATVALVANLSCLALLAKHREGGLHLKASWIFSTNDVLANLGIIVAGVLVAVTGQAWPDLVVGSAVGLLVLWGAVRILKLR